MSVYSFPLKDSGCFTVAYDIIRLSQRFYFIYQCTGKCWKSLLSIICYLLYNTLDLCTTVCVDIFLKKLRKICHKENIKLPFFAHCLA